MIACATGASYTPAGLGFDEARHRYTFNGRALINVTGALRAAGLVDLAWYSDDDRTRGSLVHAAIELFNQHGTVDAPAAIDPYVRAYQRFLADTGFRVDATEERVCDVLLQCAGTLDLRGQFPGDAAPGELVDVVDIKSGARPPWVGYQTAGYARLLPAHAPRRRRRWCLVLRADATYRLQLQDRPSDTSVFLAAVTIAQAKQGWL